MSRKLTGKSSLVAQTIMTMIIKADKPILVSISGGSCSGKSYFAAALKRGLATLGQETALVVLDEYFRDRDDPERDQNYFFDSPGAYRQSKFIADIRQLLAGNDIFMPKYDKTINMKVADKGDYVPAAAIIIAEGLYTVNFLRGLYSPCLAIYVDVDEATRLQRRIKRDCPHFGISPDKVKDIWQRYVAPAQGKFVEEQKNQADIIVEIKEEI